ncbi:MAG: SDR family oxidoreductase [Planctomycetota bacterium]|jgi:uncharacterized protein YbjT (DUF2867 family)
MSGPEKKILVAGATGYVGGRLVGILEGHSYNIRALARNPRHLLDRAYNGTDVIEGDLLDPESLSGAFVGVHTAIYLVHSMGSGGNYAELDRKAASNFLHAAEQAGVSRIIYLGGLGDCDSELSPHLASRQETGRILASGSIQVIEFRASIVLGSGSLSFEMIRALCERLPVMVTPRWVSTTAQPIAIEDLLKYLVSGIEYDGQGNHVFEIGGPDQVSYLDIMKEYSRQRKLRRLMISLPFLSPRLSSLWLGLVTPLYARIGKALIESIRNPTLVNNDDALELFDIRPIGMSDSISRALLNEDCEYAETRWSDALSSSAAQKSSAGARFGNRLVDHRATKIDTSAAEAFEPIERIGGNQGWYFATWLWVLRGWIDLSLGGVGMRRGRRNQDTLKTGEVLDFWRVQSIVRPSNLQLSAEMKVPGRAWLQWDVEPNPEGGVIVHQTAVFDPRGVWGLAYWYLIYPLHSLVFSGMLRGIERRVQKSIRREQ